MLIVIDEYSWEYRAIRTEGNQNQEIVRETLSDLFLLHGATQHRRSDNGAEFTANVVHECLERLEVQALIIEPGSPWENDQNDSFD